MNEIHYLTRVPVALLRLGLYVAELDRPWNEVPVMFQGFAISTEQELEVLREHCEFVYIEDSRSQAEAYAELDAQIRNSQDEQDAEAPAEAARPEAVRNPQKHEFARRIKAALTNRADAAAYLERTLEDVRFGRTLNAREARRAVVSLAAQVVGNSSAMMWLTTLQQKHAAVSTHAINVCVLSLAFAAYRGLRGEKLENVGLGALLHDVGKVELAPELISKPGPLDREEWEAVRRHPQAGADIVRRNKDMPPEVLEIIEMHHERLDGRGYPRGLTGEEIPEHARLVALVNSYDALTTSRAYRAGRPADEVLQELYNAREASFGAELVQDFIHCIGIFPIGSLVELNNGALGVVLESNSDNRLKPTVLLVRTPSGEHYEKRLLLNLAAEPGAEEGLAAHYIRRAVDPAAYGIDVATIVAFEFGVQWG